MRAGGKLSALAVGGCLGVIAVTVAISVGASAPKGEPVSTRKPSTESTSEPLVGKEYAEALGLPVIPELSENCHFAVETAVDPTLYCFDGSWKMNGKPDFSGSASAQVGSRRTLTFER